MLASKLITVSTVAVLLGGTSLAIGLESASSLQGSSSAQGGSAISQGGTSGSATKGPRAAENTMRRSEVSGQRGLNVQRSRELQRGQSMAAERGRAITGARALATTAERRQATTGQQIQGQLGPHGRPSFGQKEAPGLVYAREKTAGIALSPQQRERLREIMSARRDIPRASSLPDARINAVIPRNVRLAAIPQEVTRMYPRLRGRQAFMYRNELVVVDPATSRIVARLPS